MKSNFLFVIVKLSLKLKWGNTMNRRNEIHLKAYAKINLGLDVVRRREDGYHEVRMVMQTVGMYDVLDIKKSNKPGIRITSNATYIPLDEGNLVYRAVDMLFKEFDINEGVDIYLEKFIPVAAGMAGGSTDCAAAFVGINKLFSLGLNMEELMDRGAKLGADVPYCILRGTALSEGIGEILTPLNPAPNCHVVVAKPVVSVSTKYVYENLVLDENTHHPDIDGMVQAIKNGDLKGITDRMENVLETVTVKEYPQIERIKDTMKEHGAMNSLMSGSGSTVFGIYDDYDKASETLEILRKDKDVKKSYLTRFFHRYPRTEER